MKRYELVIGRVRHYLQATTRKDARKEAEGIVAYAKTKGPDPCSVSPPDVGQLCEVTDLETYKIH